MINAQILTYLLIIWGTRGERTQNCEEINPSFVFTGWKNTSSRQVLDNEQNKGHF